MKTMKWLLLREYWENKGAFFWAPAIVAAIIGFLITVILVIGFSTDGSVHVTVNGVQQSLGFAAEHATDEQRMRMIEIMTRGYMFIAAPIYLALSFIAFFYCLGALYDERRDRSILFWKSLPISDSLTVLSKVVSAAVVAPLITIAVATVISVFLLLVAGTALASKGVHVLGAVLSTPSLYLAPFQIAALIPIYLLWGLPTIGWLLMVSSWARSKVFLWAVGVPAMGVALIAWANFLFQLQWHMAWFAKNVIARGLLSLIPGSWFAFAEIAPEQLGSQVEHANAGTAFIVAQSWATLSSLDLWIGAVAGAAMIYVAIQMRRWREES